MNNPDFEKLSGITDAVSIVSEIAENNMMLLVSNAFANMNGNIKSDIVKVRNEAIELVNKLIDRSITILPYNPKLVREASINANKLLANTAYQMAQLGIKRINRLEKTIPLKDAIYKQTQHGINNGLSVTYANGRKVRYKEYMEMAVRTTIQNDIIETQINLNYENKVVFYICNEFRDCADDHAAYQGRIYYDDRYESYNLEEDVLRRVRNFINNNGLMSIQKVTKEKPFLTTRPNCRHRLVAISIERAIGVLPEETIREFKLSTGTYKPVNYKLTQHQRYLERRLRSYNARVKINRSISNGESNFKKAIAHDVRYQKEYDRRLKDFVRDNKDVLQRDYRRETREILLNDIGIKYLTQ